MDLVDDWFADLSPLTLFRQFDAFRYIRSKFVKLEEHLLADDDSLLLGLNQFH